MRVDSRGLVVQLPTKIVRCAVYTRKSTTEGLDSDFNSLDAQRDACEAYVRSQRAEGWLTLPEPYDDGGFTGGNIDRPALSQLLADIQSGQINCVVVYKVDRLSRSLLDFAKLMQVFEAHQVSFVSVTQQFNTATSMGRLVLNVLLSFAQFEREIISERTSDKMCAARRKGKWVGGPPVLGYDIDRERKRLVVNTAGFNARVPRYQHRFCNTEYGTLKFSPQELGIVCELLLRGPQTPGELRSRASRLCALKDVAEVEAALEALARREDGPFVVRLPREPGKRESRYAHLFGGEVQVDSEVEDAPPSSAEPSRLAQLETRVAQLEAEIVELKARLDALA